VGRGRRVDRGGRWRASRGVSGCDAVRGAAFTERSVAAAPSFDQRKASLIFWSVLYWLRA
jgi:hypothetical protein